MTQQGIGISRRGDALPDRGKKRRSSAGDRVEADDASCSICPMGLSRNAFDPGQSEFGVYSIENLRGPAASLRPVSRNLRPTSARLAYVTPIRPKRMKLAMRVVTGIYLVLAIAVTCGFASDPQKEPKRPRCPHWASRRRACGFRSRTSRRELEFEAPAPPAWIALADSILIPSKDGLARVDPKTKESKFGEPIGGLKQPCAGLVSAFSSLWVPNCGDGTLARAGPQDLQGDDRNSPPAQGARASESPLPPTACGC